ncbi:hypothetical protein BJX76DRAFT_368295 [Aspergillus varians]
MAKHARLLEWFEKLASRTLDLVGDYAGDELFIIEADSLLLQCFSDKTLDFSHGLQLLHVTYLVEKFLAQLYQRKCVFHIVFFSDHSQICVPPNTHEIRSFESYRCGAFEEYLNSVGAYFLMCHDGTSPVLGKAQEFAEFSKDSDTALSDDEEYSNSPPTDIWPTKILLRSMIHWFVLHGYNISLLNSLECRDSKVMSMILEGSVLAAQQHYECGTSTSASPNDTSFSSSNIDDHLPDIESLELGHDNAASIVDTKPQIMLFPGHNSRCKMMEQRILNRVVGMAKQQEFDLTQREWATVIALGILSQSSLSDDHPLEACAMLLHTTILGGCKLAERAVVQTKSQAGEPFLQGYVNIMVSVLKSKFWHEFGTQIRCSCDLADAIDGRLFLETLRVLKQTKNTRAFSAPTLKRFEVLKLALWNLFEIEIPSIEIGPGSEKSNINARKPRPGVGLANINKKECIGILPFNNPIIDAHLKPVSVIVDDSADEATSSSMSRTFQELSRWHTHKRLLNPRLNSPLTEWQKMRINRRNQSFMNDVTRYAGSLTNSVGGSLQPETVSVKSRKDKLPNKMKGSKGGTQLAAGGPEVNQRPSSLARNKRGHPAKTAIRDQIKAQQLLKQNEITNKHFSALKVMTENFEMERDYSTRYIKVKQYLEGLPPDKRNTVEVEVLAYMTSTLVLVWKERCKTRPGESPMPVVALIWHTIQQIARAKHGVTHEIAECIQNTISALKLPSLELPRHEKRRMSFNFAILHIGTANVDVGLSPTDFQLIHAGPYMDRSMGSAPDPRVHDFEPDEWQQQVLNQIDARGSLFVVAPTSAGKTFISFYAIRQVLEDDDDGILVYVAPTKALVNQIAAEVQARFSKNFNNTPGKSVWAIHTRDYRINNPNGCQVLITVPHILQIMLLAPTNAKSWSPRIRRIIFDEVHCIGQAEDGVIWEQLLLLAPCPIIALSATVGNPDEFKQWLGMAQEANELDLRMIQHKTRYSDLRKFIYNPPSKFIFNGISGQPRLATLGLDESPNMAFLHPIASLIDRSRGLPDDLALEPRDCLMLWKAMKKHTTKEFPLDERLDPYTTLTVMRDWMSHDNSPFEAVVEELSQNVSTTGPDIQVSGELQESLDADIVDKSSVLDTTLPLVCSLHEQGALPALFFNYDRAYCEKICLHLLTQLLQSEERWKATSPIWKKELVKFGEWQKAQKKKDMVKEPKRKKGRRGDDDDDDKVSQEDLTREKASKESSRFESFNPDDPVSGFHFADEKKLTPSEFEKYAMELRRFDVSELFISALKRGIGIHHAGMNRRYRQVCEILFRKGYLRVVIATGTLALGINMPCKTVVFSGDSVFLTALNFRQAAGRAGRRGFDFLGNVVFQGLTYQKVCRLLSSRLPDLNGHFPITTSLVLRLFILLQESKQAPYAVNAVNSILSCPRIYLGGPESKHTVLHHLRFSIEYLRRCWLLDREGKPLNFAGLVSHLYYTENSSFAFHALLSEGYFHRLCKDINHKPKETLRTLMLVMSHLFGRFFLRPKLPERAAKILDSHNKKTLSIYSAYVATFIDQHIQDSDDTLPLTSTKCGGDTSANDVSTSMSFLEPVRVTSSFIALSGHRDGWNSIPALCNMVRNGVWLEQSAIPHIQVTPEQGQAPLNAYLYDFFKHGNVHALVNENKIRKGDVWFVLNDFSLVLATIVTSLENFMKLSPGTDCEMLDTMGSGDAIEEELEDRALGAVGGPISPAELPPSKGKQPAGAAATRPAQTKKPKVSDNWDDDLSGDDEESHAPSPRNNVTRQSRNESEPFSKPDADANFQGQGLIQVLQAFKFVQAEFNEKFKEMWA